MLARTASFGTPGATLKNVGWRTRNMPYKRMRDRLRFLPHGLLLLACGGPERSTDTPKAPLGPTSAKAIDPFSWKGSPYDVEAMMKAPLDSMETSECKYVAVEMEKLRKTSKSEAEASKKVEAKTQGPGKDADCWKSWLKLVALAHDFAVRGGEAPGLLVSIAQSARRHSDCLSSPNLLSPIPSHPACE